MNFFKNVKFFLNFLYRSGPLLASLATKLGGQVCIIESEICIIHCNRIIAITFSKVVATECCPDDQTAIRRHLVRFQI